ncbi:actin-like ATPase domain-containing protein [Tilletiaria anomala UBC 951]|uniref:Actin-like ATPase domain-containing protein n=1 Tax=Tilletiaria anomala (strain ATCC 24038 / CBS 436.72 / UBC 951) TaxID=1037660 RepID=A0A066WBS1_TILAU|nr:actin-like ATPase domain-containing protein [Tilletiaria anomala UBC 951]KDN48225.1 actin-like ATPase domain-containing protein [Tilletiaria anomala UBC 951]
MDDASAALGEKERPHPAPLRSTVPGAKAPAYGGNDALPSSISTATRASARASSSSSGTSAYVPMQRRLLSLHGTDDRVVLDIGSRVTKFGFSGEPTPRGIISSIVLPPEWSSFERKGDNGKGKGKERALEEGDQDMCLWSYDLSRCEGEAERRAARRLLEAQVEELIRNIYVQHLRVDTKQRHVLILDSPSTPLPLRKVLLKVLFSQFRVPSVAFLSSPLMALMATGRITGLVVDVSGGGARAETSITPIYCGRILESARTVTPTAGNSVRCRLKRLLLSEGRYCYCTHARPANSNGHDGAYSKPTRHVERIPPDLLTSHVVEELMTRVCLVARFDACPNPDAPKDDSVESLKARHASKARAKTLCVPVASLQSAQEWIKGRAESLLATHMASLGPNRIPSSTVTLTTSLRADAMVPGTTFPQSAVLLVPGWVRECAAEVMFEDGDLDEPSISEAVLSSLLKLPIDLRRNLASLILVTGGMAMLPSLPHRLAQQLALSLQTLASEIDSSKPLTPAVLRKANRYAPLRNLASSIGVLNDHAPNLPPIPPPDLPREDKSQVKKTLVAPPPMSGSAPVFAANLLPWIGASIVGALQTTSIYEMKREEWDAEQAALHAPLGPTLPMPVTFGQGSFMGVVGGLETGAFGGLSAVSRHLMSPTSESTPRSPPLGRSLTGSRC